MKFIISAMLLCFSVTASAGYAGYPAKTGSSLQVYRSASLDNPIKGALVSIVLIDSCKGNWCAIEYIAPNIKKLRAGWVPLSSIKIREVVDAQSGLDEVDTVATPVTPEITQKPCDLKKAAPVITVVPEKFKCSEGSFKPGYDKCEAKLAYSIQSACQPKGLPSLYFSCDISVESSGDTSLLPMRKSAKKPDYVYLSDVNQTGTMSIMIDVSNVFEKIIQVKLKDARCEIDPY